MTHTNNPTEQQATPTSEEKLSAALKLLVNRSALSHRTPEMLEVEHYFLMKLVHQYGNTRESGVKETIVAEKPRAYGKTAHQFEIFQQAIEEGKTAEWHGPDYVVLNRKRYDELTKAKEQAK